MKRICLFVLSCLAALSFAAHAEIYKRVDADGHVTYSSTPIKGAKKLHLDPLPTLPPPPKAGANFPRVDESTQSRRDDARRRILEDELASEQKALETARAQLKDAQEHPPMFQDATGKTFRNTAQQEANIAAAQEDVTAHEKNVEAIQTELANIK